MQSIELVHNDNNNNTKIRARIRTFGATLTHLIVTDLRSGTERDVVLGFDNAELYNTRQNKYFGCTVGRVANRIGKGRFSLPSDPKRIYALAVNNGPNSLHGGQVGFSHRVWQVIKQDSDYEITLQYVSADGEEGYPGQLTAQVTYRVAEGKLVISFKAWLSGDSATATIVNLTNHSYFNLSGRPSEELITKNHDFTLHSGKYLVLDDTSLPTGEIASVEGTVMDLRKPCVLAGRIETLKMGYDHCYVTGNDGELEPKEAAVVTCNGLTMRFSTSEPGYQFYTGNYLGGEGEGVETKSSHSNGKYAKWSGFCLEAQRFPDAANKPQWAKQVILERDDIYTQTTSYAFSFQ